MGEGGGVCERGDGRTSSRPRTALLLLHITIRHKRPTDINRIRRIQPRRRLLHAMHDRVRPIERAEIEIMLIGQHLGAVDRAQRRGVEGEQQGHERRHCCAAGVDVHAGWVVGAKLRGEEMGDARRRRVGAVGEEWVGWMRMCVWFAQWDGRGRASAVGAPVAGVAVAAAWPDLVMTRCVARSRTCFCNRQGTSLGT